MKKSRSLLFEARGSVRRFDEDQASGSNGLLRWTNDRGYLFAIPVDMEWTQPGGKVVFARDDANITDWIQNALNGYTLRLSRNGRLYVEGRDGLPPELAEIFGRYPRMGANDGIAGQIAAETGFRGGETPEALVEALRSDRRAYDDWKRGRNAEAEHWAEEEARADAEAEQRWSDSGMNAVDYIRSRIDEGAPGFDLDWEHQRMIEHDRAEGRFHVERQRIANARINSVMDDLSTIENSLEKDRTKKAHYYRQINERYGSEYEFDLGIPFGTISKFIPQKPIRLKLKTLLRKKKEEYQNHHPFSFADVKDIVEKINYPAFVLKRQRSHEGVRAFYETTSGKVFCASVLPNGEINEIDTLYPKDIERLVNVVKSFQSDSKMLLDCDKYKTLSILERQYNTTIIPENRKGLETAISILKSFGSVNGRTLKERQFEVIQKTNKAQDDVHAWIRSVDDIKTAQEAFEADNAVTEGFAPDAGPEVYAEALKTGKIKVYSSKPIENGNFVTPSRMEAKNYAGNGQVYEALLPLDSIAWIDAGQGQVAKVDQPQVNQAKFNAGPSQPRLNRRNFIAGRAMVAEDYGRGEQTPGALAASRELDRRHSSPIADNLKLHGFFMNEDPAWLSAHSPVEIAHEKEWNGGLSPFFR